MARPLVTTIIPTFERAALLRRAVRSAQTQTFEAVEILVLDNASSDETPAMMRRLAEADPRISYVRREQNVGAIANFRDGLVRVATPYFSFLSDDDYLLPDFYRTCVEVLEGDPEAGLVAGGLIMAHEGGPVTYTLDTWCDVGRLTPFRAVERLSSSLIAGWNAALFRTEAARTFGLDERLHLTMDLLLMLQVSAAHPTWVINHPFAVQRIDRTTIGGSAPLQEVVHDWTRFASIFEAEVAPVLGDQAGPAVALMTASLERTKHAIQQEQVRRADGTADQEAACLEAERTENRQRAAGGGARRWARAVHGLLRALLRGSPTRRRIAVDLDLGSVTVEQDGRLVRHGLDTPEAFGILSDIWLRAGWYNKYVYTFTWLGRPIIQLPDDMFRIQELIYGLRPDVIVETGVAHGGSLVFYASLCRLLGTGRVIGVDVDIRPHNRTAIEDHPLAPLITLVVGDSTDPSVVAQVEALIAPDERVLVLLDSKHTKEHVLSELRAYSRLVQPGSYLVAMDGIMEQVAGGVRTEADWTWNNPKRAAQAFVEEHPDFRIEEPELLFNESELRTRVTHWPSAFVKRISRSAIDED